MTMLYMTDDIKLPLNQSHGFHQTLYTGDFPLAFNSLIHEKQKKLSLLQIYEKSIKRCSYYSFQFPNNC